ncbi:MAG: D-tyrosyl-tRNA(Tyr) deacylase [Elusimicrobia bacterium]|nr:MAG: D-tyrosyl-tRNA(Tyr) deacylase [Elusimicrobiota bacterium]KAF0155949.1 MAG: D-tyrosyl-tRNA(Tyr) deacylase [Elusimicrobiota bacterium]
MTVDGAVAASIGPGLLVLLGVGHDDTADDAVSLAARTASLRIFSNAEGKFDLSVLDAGGEALVVSQFTLYADSSRGRRPDFTAAAKPDKAEALYLDFADALRSRGVTVKTGVFGADMKVSLVNDGPVTIWLDTDKGVKPAEARA